MTEEKIKEAIRVVLDYNLCSSSLLIRKMNVTYNEAMELIEEMENRKIVSEFLGSRPRKILISN